MRRISSEKTTVKFNGQKKLFDRVKSKFKSDSQVESETVSVVEDKKVEEGHVQFLAQSEQGMIF